MRITILSEEKLKHLSSSVCSKHKTITEGCPICYRALNLAKAVALEIQIKRS